MRTPKRFKLNAVARDKDPGDGLPLQAVYYHDGALWASDGRTIARVPLLKHGERPGAELPRLEADECGPVAAVPPRAWAEATKGKTGEGRLVATPTGYEGQAAPDKGWLRHPSPEGAEDETLDELAAAVEAAQEPPSEGYATVEVSIDAEALVALSRALGGDGGVRLRFHVTPDGTPDSTHGAILVQPVDRRGADEPVGVIMAILGGA